MPSAIRAFAIALALSACPTFAVDAAAPAVPPQIGEAIARAVAERIGGNANVIVSDVQTLATGHAALVASPEPGARTSTAARFTLYANGARVGTAVATVHVTARHARARRAIARGETLTAADVEDVDAALDDQPIRRVPVLADVIGARVKRNVIAGESITAVVIEVPPVVKSGDVVMATVRVGAVEAEGRTVASGSGHVGSIVRVTAPGTRRLLRARITGPGRVEILQ
jgi:flagella basal body P-ring formation protein FlgA